MENSISFKESMQQHGVVCHDPIIADAQLHRFAPSGKGDKSGWYVLYGEVGIYGIWGKVDSTTWYTHKDYHLSPELQKTLQQKIREANAIRDKEYEEAAKQAQAEWKSLSESGTSRYLESKQATAHGIRYGKGYIAVPLCDNEGKLWSLQRIYDTDSIHAYLEGRNKTFLKGGRKRGCFHVIGTIENGKPFYCVEGYATGVSVHMAMGIPTVIAFDAGNLEPVIAELRGYYPESPITIAADNDQWKDINTGKDKAESVAQKFGCTVALPHFVDNLKKEKPTDYNDLHCLAGVEEVKKQLQLVTPKPPQSYVPEPFCLNKNGVFYVSPDSNKAPLKLCSPLHIVAYTHDEDDNNHGRFLQWKSPKSGKIHRWALPCRLLASEGTEIFARLLDEGLEVSPSRTARNRLLEYIQAVIPAKTRISLSKIGWHGDVFALPDQVFPEHSTMLLQTEDRNFGSFKVAGTLEEWQTHVAQYAHGNTRLVFALSVAFAAPLLQLVSEESGILHLVGKSSKGKTSALRIAASVWGSGGESGFIKQWRATGNALEAIAESHRDCLLLLDEMGQADSKTVGDTVYMLANNQGKGRLSSTTTLRKSFEWRVLVLSSGEISLDAKMAEVSKKPQAGMQVRCVNIPAEIEGAHGVFENLHHFPNGETFSQHFKEACGKYYGSAIRAYLSQVVDKREGITAILQKIKEDFFNNYVPNGADGQVKRVASRFALIGAAGELAIECGVLPLCQNEAIHASAQCFSDWLEQRGSINSSELEDGIQQIKSFFERYGNSKFISLDEISNTEIAEYGVKPIERVGYKQKLDGVYHYYVLSQAYKNELCKGYDAKSLTKALVQRGCLITDKSGKNQIVKKIPGMGAVRVYHFSPTIISETGEGC